MRTDLRALAWPDSIVAVEDVIVESSLQMARLAWPHVGGGSNADFNAISKQFSDAVTARPGDRLDPQKGVFAVGCHGWMHVCIL